MVKKLNFGDEISIMFDNQLIKRVRLAEGTELKITMKNGSVVIEIVPLSLQKSATDESEVDSRVLEAADKFMKKHAAALKKLAKN